jgi:hypothetical protein
MRRFVFLPSETVKTESFGEVKLDAAARCRFVSQVSLYCAVAALLMLRSYVSGILCRPCYYFASWWMHNLHGRIQFRLTNLLSCRELCEPATMPVACRVTLVLLQSNDLLIQYIVKSCTTVAAGQ